MMLLQGQADLLEVVLTLRSHSRGAHLLHSGQDQSHQQRNDPNSEEKFQQREAPVTAELTHRLTPSPVTPTPRMLSGTTRLPPSSRNSSLSIWNGPGRIT